MLTDVNRSMPLRRASLRESLHRSFVRRRGVAVRLHRWLALVLLLWIVVESVTGSALVFAGQIDRAVNHRQFTPTEGDVGLVKAVAAARDARPDDHLSFVTSPTADDSGGMYLVWMLDEEAKYHTVVVDPGSGNVTSADHRAPALIELFERVHFNLNSTSIFGIQPITVLGWLAVGWLVVLLSGFYVWYWPGVKRWARALRVRRQRGRFTFHLDLHKAVGIASFVPLVLIVVTGMQFAFPNQVRTVWNTVTFHTYEAPDTTVPLSGASAGEAITADDAVAIVSKIDPSLVVQTVETPNGSPVGVYTVSATADPSLFGLASGSRTVEFAVDQYTGAVVSIEDPRDKGFASAAYDDWSYQIHFGTFGGTPTMVLWVVVGLLPTVLAVTGVVMWIVRRNKRRRRAVAAAPTELQGVPS